MRLFRLLIALGSLLMPLLLVPLSASMAEPVKFANSQIAADGARYEAFLAKNWAGNKSKVSELMARGASALKNDARAASRYFAGAAAKSPQSPEAWLGLARSLLGMDEKSLRGSERYDIPVNASGAAYIAFQRAQSDDLKADALVVLTDALQRRSFWRPAIAALKASLDIKPNPIVQAAYDKLRAEHGFRMVNYSTQSDVAQPRVCLQFSEGLASGPVNFSSFVSVNGRDPQGVNPEGQELCIDGFAHGERYEVRVRAGLPSGVGEVLEKPIELAVFVPDRKPFARFTGRAYVLPSRGQQGIPVVSVNTDAVDIEVYRIGDRSLVSTLQDGDLDRQLGSWNLEQIKSRSGERVYDGKLEVKSQLNAEVTTAFPVSEAIGTLKPGVYAMTAKSGVVTGEYQNQIATQWFIVSDIGLTAFSGDDGVHAFVRSLAETSAMAGVEVRLIARNNEVLATAKTDSSGYARFDSGLTRGEGGLQPAMLVAQTGTTDYAFLDLTSGAFDLSDRGVTGRDAPGAIDGYLYTERGVYRPGEEVHLTSLVRSREGKALSLPVTLIITRPDGVEHRRIVLDDKGAGGREASLALTDAAMTGTWRAMLHVDPKASAITQTAFLVEDFVPERLDMTLAAQDGALRPNVDFVVDASGMYLYGPPADGLVLEGEIIVREAKSVNAELAGYKFGMADETVQPVRENLADLTATDSSGKAKILVGLPKVMKTAKPLSADLLVRLRETSGRTIERKISVPVDLGLERIGIKPLFDNGVGDGEAARFDVIKLAGDGTRTDAKGLAWQLDRLDTTWQWYSRDGYWSYEAVTLTRKVADGTLDVTAGEPGKLELPVEWGRYQLEVTSGEADGAVTTVQFNAGWYSGGDNPESPEMLDVALDKKSYSAGDTAKLRIVDKLGGRALIAVLSGDMKSFQEVDVRKGGGSIDVKVGNDWGAGAYVTAMLYRPMDETAKRMPSRAAGIQWLGLDQSPRTLGVQLGVADKITSGDGLKIPVSISGLKAGEAAYMTVAAVDVGIVNLTRFATPAPEGHFYAQTKLGTEIRDFYGRLIDGMRAERGKLRSGGDADGGMQAEGSPPVEETVALYSGIVTVGPDGTASVDFDLPDFNGSVRVMAVAWSADKLGSAATDVIVRDPIAVTSSAPRFMTLGDEVRLGLDMHNVDGPDGTYRLSVDQQIGEGALSTILSRDVALKNGERRPERFNVKPSQIGPHTFAVRISGPGNVAVARTLRFDVKPPAGDIKRITVSSIKPGGKLTVSSDLVADMIGQRTVVNVSVGRAARFDVPGLLAQLDRYPYGCAEQTVSRALPLVYANALATRVGMGQDEAIRSRVQGAVDRVFAMQDGSGAFGAWGPAYTDLWLTAYVTDFLTRAKETGYAVNPIGFGQALDRLQNFIAYAQDFEKGGEDRAYALYVLARNGRAPAGELRYYADTRLKRFSSPLAKAQIGAALAMIGDKPRAETVFASAIADMRAPAEVVARSDYGSLLRDGAALVTLTSESGIAKSEAPKLIDTVAEAFQSQAYTSTQEQAWMLLAANSLTDGAGSARLSVDGVAQDGALMKAISPAELEGRGIEIANTGDAEVDAVISVVGAALTPEPAVSKGFAITRNAFTLDGKAVALDSATGGTSEIAQNQRLVMVVNVTTQNEGGRVLVVDRLPAGLEIENPRLVDGGDIKALDWLKTNERPEHTEFRDDRFVAAFNFSGGNGGRMEPAGTTMTMAYVVRAVTPGSYVHPAATVEDMYRAEHHARTDTGRLVVTPAE